MASDFASKYNFALADSSDSNSDGGGDNFGTKAITPVKEVKTESKIQQAADNNSKVSKFNTMLQGMLSESDSDSDDAGAMLAKYRAAKQQKLQESDRKQEESPKIVAAATVEVQSEEIAAVASEAPT